MRLSSDAYKMDQMVSCQIFVFFRENKSHADVGLLVIEVSSTIIVYLNFYS